VTARYNEAHVKYLKKRELTMMLMVDISGSESFGSNLKNIVTEIAARLFCNAE
jgi:uncharacterized protein (DUF58 family)